jgi:hypothetical protein
VRPVGASAGARQREDMVTWQPVTAPRRCGWCRSAAARSWPARSLREVESREYDVRAVAGLAWLTCLVLAVTACAFVDVLRTSGYG